MPENGLCNWSTDDLGHRDRFSQFQRINNQSHGMWKLKPSRQGRFNAAIQLVQAGDYTISRAITDPLTGVRQKSDIAQDPREFFVLMYMAEGACVLEQGGHESYIREHHIAMWDSARPAATHFEKPIRQLSVFIPRSLGLTLIPGIERLCGLSIDGKGSIGRILTSHLLTLEQNVAAIPAELAPSLMQATIQLVGSLFQPSECKLAQMVRRPALLRVQEHILNNLGDHDMSVSSVAADLGYNTRYLHRLFSDFDFSLSDWIKRRRLLAARVALASLPATAISIGQVAQRYGFRDQSHFSRAFKDAFGTSPKEYRKAELGRRSSEMPSEQADLIS